MTTLFAPAKINLYLHVNGRRPDGYHILDSLVLFANWGDTIRMKNADGSRTDSCRFTGPLAGSLAEMPADQNLALRALHLARQYVDLPAQDLTIEKHIPAAGGLGGGSSNAATVLRHVLQVSDFNALPHDQQNAMTELGADIPVCYQARPCFVQGVGEILRPCTSLPEGGIPALICTPPTSLSTKEVFTAYDQSRTGNTTEPCIRAPVSAADHRTCTQALRAQTRNDLSPAAEGLCPEIRAGITILKTTQSCLLARMAGSGPSMFGLFKNRDAAEQAALVIRAQNPEWSVVPCNLETQA